jgi:hypothetical protein
MWVPAQLGSLGTVAETGIPVRIENAESKGSCREYWNYMFYDIQTAWQVTDFVIFPLFTA